MGAADQRGQQQHVSNGDFPIMIHCGGGGGGGVNPNHNRPGRIIGGWQCGCGSAVSRCGHAAMRPLDLSGDVNHLEHTIIGRLCHI